MSDPKPNNVTELFYREPRPLQPRGNFADRMVRTAGVVAQNMPANLAGYIVIGVDEEGQFQVGWACRTDTLIGPTMLAALGKAAIDRDIIGSLVIEDAKRE